MQRSTTDAPPAAAPAWDWPSAALVLLLIQVAAARLVMTAWTPFLFYVQTLAAFGCAVGLALAHSQFTRRQTYWLAIGYTAVVVPWQLLGALESNAGLLTRLGELGGRLWISLAQFFERKPVDDALLFVALAALGFWIMSLVAGYAFASRGNYLAAVLPAAITMLLIQAYDYFVPVRIWSIGVYAFLALLLLGRLYLLTNRTGWEKGRVFVTAEARSDLMKSLVTISTISVVAAWSIPSSLSDLEAAAESWNEFTRPFRERFSNAVSALESPQSGGSGSGGDFYGPSLLLSLRAPLGDTPVFSVTVDEEGQNAPPRYYWRGHVYNYYANGKWSTTSARTTEFQPESGDLQIPPTSLEREEIAFTVAVRVPQQTLLYTPAEPVWIDRPGAMYTAVTPDGEDLAAWEADPGLTTGDRYEVRALIANPTVDSLRQAGTEYPEWVTARYLEVPEALLPELRALAEEITAEQLTTYDKAQAITFYLRQEMQYEPVLTAPPQGRDPVLWMLFESRKGFCTQYASAAVLLLRSLGIPARMAVGFAEGQAAERSFGERIIQTNYIVRRVDAHAWPEVYFPGLGWVEFEPTGNQDPLLRPLSVAPTNSSVDPSSPAPRLGLGEFESDVLGAGRVDGSASAAPFSETPAARALWFGSLAVLAAAAYFLDRRFQWFARLPDYLIESYGDSTSRAPGWLQRWSRWNQLTSIERSFQAVNLSLHWLGKPQPVHMTPIARAATLHKLLPSAGPQIDALLNEHQSSLYTPRPGDPARARNAAFGLLGRTVQLRLRALIGFFTGTPIHPDSQS